MNPPPVDPTGGWSEIVKQGGTGLVVLLLGFGVWVLWKALVEKDNYIRAMTRETLDVMNALKTAVQEQSRGNQSVAESVNRLKDMIERK